MLSFILVSPAVWERSNASLSGNKSIENKGSHLWMEIWTQKGFFSLCDIFEHLGNRLDGAPGNPLTLLNLNHILGIYKKP